MVLEPPDVDIDKLTDADKAILDELHGGARTKKAIVDATGLHRNTVGNRLDVLEAGEAVKCIHNTTALYELVDDPRLADTEQVQDESDLLEAVQEELHEVTAERDELEAALEDCREQLTDARAVDADAALRAIEDAEAAAERGDGDALRNALARAKEAIDE